MEHKKNLFVMTMFGIASITITSFFLIKPNENLEKPTAPKKPTVSYRPSLESIINLPDKDIDLALAHFIVAS